MQCKHSNQALQPKGMDPSNTLGTFYGKCKLCDRFLWFLFLQTWIECGQDGVSWKQQLEWYLVHSRCSLLVTVINTGALILARGQREEVAKCFHFLFLLIKGETGLVFPPMNPGGILSSVNPKTPFPYSQACWFRCSCKYWTLLTCIHNPLGLRFPNPPGEPTLEKQHVFIPSDQWCSTFQMLRPFITVL